MIVSRLLIVFYVDGIELWTVVLRQASNNTINIHVTLVS